VSPSVGDGGDQTKALVQIFNAAPASTKLARPTLREFFLRSAFAPSCLVDATGSISVVRAVRAVPAMVRVLRARVVRVVGVVRVSWH
jgi:hypothetical protein